MLKNISNKGAVMNFILDIYMHLNVRTRIALLSICYSFCIIFAVIAGRIFSQTTAILSTVIFVFLGIVFSSLLFVSINDALKRVIGYLTILANGNLTQNIAPKRNNEISTIIRAIASLQASMHNIITKITNSSEQVSLISSQLQNSSNQIAEGSQQVAAQTNTVAVASEEMSATSNNIAHNCLSAAENSNRASSTARTGAEVVRQTADGMGRIALQVKDAAKTVGNLGARSEQIGQIIGTIEDIADQTNLLALNAAIEAARAGEQGRGFAVVADEVRALAERTTRATREIGEMIKAIQRETNGAMIAMEQGVKQVEKGTEEAAESGQALAEILDQIDAVTTQVNQIATAAEEQTATTGEISSNMQKISEVVQQTSRGAQESATAAAQLNNNAEEMQQLVRQFKLS